MNRDMSIEKLGKAGETILVNHFIQAGKKIVVSENQFDSEKDMIIDGERIEVKTQVPFVFKNSFTIKYNQLKKCKNADKVIFISVPNRRKKHFSDGKVYIIESKKIKVDKYLTKDGREMLLIPIKQKDMKELFTLTEEQCKMLQSYSVSSWN